jgi:hypothetical protein
MRSQSFGFVERSGVYCSSFPVRVRDRVTKLAGKSLTHAPLPVGFLGFLRKIEC